MKLPDEVQAALESVLKGLVYGSVTLEIKVHAGKPQFRIIKEISIRPEIKKGEE